MKTWKDLQAALPEANRRLKASHQIWYDNGTGYWELDATQGVLSQANALDAARNPTPFGYQQIAVEVGIDPNHN